MPACWLLTPLVADDDFFNNHHWDCHSERSEESDLSAAEILRCAQNDSPGLDCER